MMILKLIMVAATFGFLFNQPVSAQQIQTFGRGGKVIKLSNAKLTSKQRRHFKEFKKNKSYFGYFYIATDEDYSLAAQGQHNLESARVGGEKACRAFSKSGKATCIPYAIALPKSVSNSTRKASGLGITALKVYTGRFARDFKKRKGWAAFAISGMENFGWSTGYASQAEAVDTALQYCLSSTADTLIEFPFEFRKWIKKVGYDKCQIVHVAQN